MPRLLCIQCLYRERMSSRIDPRMREVWLNSLVVYFIRWNFHGWAPEKPEAPLKDGV